MWSEADWQAHHLINLAATRRNNPVIEAAARAGWLPDAPQNVLALPTTLDAKQRLQAAGIQRPIHDSSHRKWNDRTDERLLEIRKELAIGAGAAASPEKDRAAFDALKAFQRELLQEILKQERVTMLEQFGETWTA